jgi:hypothetical protein
MIQWKNIHIRENTVFLFTISINKKIEIVL